MEYIEEIVGELKSMRREAMKEKNEEKYKTLGKAIDTIRWMSEFDKVVDAIREWGAVKPIKNAEVYKCVNCSHVVGYNMESRCQRTGDETEGRLYRYCPECGRKVRWV